jgi:apolipoprotein N-acyltransferase
MASALVMRLAFPRWNLYPIAAVGLVPFLWAVSCATSGKQAFYLGWVYGAVFYYVLLIWLNILVAYYPPIPPVIVLLAVYLGLFKGLFAWLSWSARGPRWWGLLAAPAAWVAVEYLQSLGDLGFPWGYLGHSPWRHPWLIQLAAWTGVYGLSLVFFWINHLVCDGLRCLQRETEAPPVRQLLIRAAILPLFGAAMYLSTHDALNHAQSADFYTTPPMTVGMVQPNIAQRDKFRSYDAGTPENERDRLQREMFVKTLRLTYQMQSGPENERCDLIIWPESAMTDDFFTLRPAYATFFRDLPTSLSVPVLFGATNLLVFRNGRFVPPKEFDPEDYQLNPDAYALEVYNSAFLAEPGSGLNPSVYNKMRLVPFAEGIPYVQHVKPLVNLIGEIAQMEPFKSGKDHTVYEMRSHRDDSARLRFGPLICFESCYPNLSRALVRRGAEMLVIITNDGWYERTAGPAQHELEAVFRAVETRRAVARCANTGLSCFISPWGEMEKETELATDATAKWRVRGVKELTFYARWGDVFAWLAVAITACFIIVRKLLG